MGRIQIIAILGFLALFLIVFELVRRRRLQERYALLWLFAVAGLLGLSIWRNLLEKTSNAIGVAYAPSALFAVAFAFILLLLLHFSLVISRLADQNKVLAQKLGQLQQRVDQLESAASVVAAETDGDVVEAGASPRAGLR